MVEPEKVFYFVLFVGYGIWDSFVKAKKNFGGNICSIDIRFQSCKITVSF